MKFVKTVAVGLGAIVALGVAATSATAAPSKPTAAPSMKMQKLVGTCGTGASGAIAIKNDVANLTLPEQLSWAQIRAYPQNLKLSDLKTLTFESKTSHPGVVYMKINTDHGSVMFSPNTQAALEIVGPDWGDYDVLADTSTVRYNDDAGERPDVSWNEMLTSVAGDATILDVRLTAGCANPVGDGASVQFDNLTINDMVFDFAKPGK
jgi:hypothetical protein